MSTELNSRICAITGPTRGIGRETAQQLSALGYHLLLLCRDPAQGQVLRSQLPGSSDVLYCDLGEAKSVVQAAQQIKSNHKNLNVLINNAGILETRRRFIAGTGAMMAINHLGHFLLTQRLLPLLLQTEDSRIIVTSSSAHRLGRLSTADPLCRHQPAAGLMAYGRSKLANLLFALSLAKRLEGSNTVCNALHPGVVLSNLMLASGGWIGSLSGLIKPFVMSAADGAATSVYLASDPTAGKLHGQYLDQQQRIVSPSRRAKDRQLQNALWNASERALAAYLTDQ
ncbi:MAG: SDR family NAD(P)-dependent oxidoreductase [Pseudomonadales bacterium]